MAGGAGWRMVSGRQLGCRGRGSGQRWAVTRGRPELVSGEAKQRGGVGGGREAEERV